MGGMANVSGGYGGGTSTGGKGMQTPNNGYSSQYERCCLCCVITILNIFI